MPYTQPSPHPRLQAFVASLSSLVNRQPDEATIRTEGAELLCDLASHDDWLPDAQALADTSRYQQFLLYRDPRSRFSVVSFVWGPGQSTPIHDHTVWGIVGVLRGQEGSQRYVVDDRGRCVASGPAEILLPGQVDCVSPAIGDVHKVWNALPDQPSISIHVYGADIGRLSRIVFAPDGSRKPFVSGYSNPLPEWHAPAGQPLTTVAEVLEALRTRQEIALLDVREEEPYAQGHPLFAANLPLSRLEADAFTRLPRRDTWIVVYDDGEGLAGTASLRLQRLGYTRVTLLEGGLQGWCDAGAELFRDVNAPSKAFGELVASVRNTPSLSAAELQALIEAGTDLLVLDVRRPDEHRTMNIPSSINVPGAELVMRARALAPSSSTPIVVNCAGRTRSFLGAQSLINAGLPHRVAALRNGTIGWLLAGQELEIGAERTYTDVSPEQLSQAQAEARAVADRAGVRRLPRAELEAWLASTTRTIYCCDVRSPAEYAAGHLPGSLCTPGGQLVQEIDHTAPVRGARLLLIDPQAVRADMTASWLAQMGWEVVVLDGLVAADLSESGPERRRYPPAEGHAIDVAQLRTWLAEGSDTLVIDLGTAEQFIQGHLRGALGLLRSTLPFDLRQALASRAHPPRRCVLTCVDGVASAYAAADLIEALEASGVAATVHRLEGGNAAWAAAGEGLDTGSEGLLAQRIDRYRRPYEGTGNPVSAMQAYLDWEYGLVEQLHRDGTHHFSVI